MAASKTYLQAATDTSDLSTYTFSSQNLGSADSTRRIVVCIESRGTTSQTINSVTVAGVSASVVASQTNSFNIVAQYIAEVPSGTSGDVVVTFADSMLRCAIQMYRLTDVDSTTATDAGTSVATDPTFDLDIPADGCAIANVVTGDSTGSVSWTNLTEDYDGITEYILASSASDEFASEQTGLTITGNPTGTVSPVGVFASWGPATGGSTFAASAALTMPAATMAASATFAPGTKTATAALTMAAASMAASATFTAPEYSATAATTTSPATMAASATFAPEVYQATASLSTATATMAASATFDAGTFTATAALSTAAATMAASATFDAGTFTATAALTTAAATMTASGLVTAPGAGLYTAVANLVTAALTMNAAGSFTGPVLGPATINYRATGGRPWFAAEGGRLRYRASGGRLWFKAKGAT